MVDEKESCLQAVVDMHSTMQQLKDKFGPKVWCLTSSGDLYEGGIMVASSDVGFTDGDVVTIDLQASVLSFRVNGVRVPGEFSSKIMMRTAVAVNLENKGASVEILKTSLDEFESVINDGAALENVEMTTDDLRKMLEEKEEEERGGGLSG